MNLKIVFVNHSIANNFGDWIEINEEMKRYPYLLKETIDHEYGHTQTSGFTWHDFKHDLAIKPKTILYLLYFNLRHPSSWLQYVPMKLRKGKIYLDVNMIVLTSSLTIAMFLYKYRHLLFS